MNDRHGVSRWPWRDNIHKLNFKEFIQFSEDENVLEMHFNFNLLIEVV